MRAEQAAPAVEEARPMQTPALAARTVGMEPQAEVELQEEKVRAARPGPLERAQGPCSQAAEAEAAINTAERHLALQAVLAVAEAALSATQLQTSGEEPYGIIAPQPPAAA